MVVEPLGLVRLPQTDDRLSCFLVRTGIGKYTAMSKQLNGISSKGTPTGHTMTMAPACNFKGLVFGVRAVNLV